MSRHAIAALLVAASIVSTSAFAGGPLGIFDPATNKPYAWPAGDTTYYTDLGPNGILDNTLATLQVNEGTNQWNAVATSTFNGVHGGDFSVLDLPDIDGSNFDLVVGAWNGGGIQVIFDTDGSVMEAVVGSAYVYGVTIIEFVDEMTGDILEATVVLNGSTIPSYYTPQEALLRFGGVATHELGHAAGLAHSQTNGAILRGYENDPVTWIPNLGPGNCDTPYTDGPTNDDIETMYPFVTLSSTGEPMFTVDISDDISTLSTLYPADGFGMSPTLTGTVYSTATLAYNPDDESSDDECSDGDDESSDDDCDGQTDAPFMGVNVIARNVMDPWRDAISGQAGNWCGNFDTPCGDYYFAGLQEDTTYVVYVDGLWGGAFSTPHHTYLPGPEEYNNGMNESGNGITDANCEWNEIALTTGTPADADIWFNSVEGAPVLYPIELPSSGVSGLNADGTIGVGSSAIEVFRWEKATGEVELIGGSYRALSPGISPNSQWVASEVFYPPEDYLQMAGYWLGGKDWMEHPDPGTEPCGDGNWTSAWAVGDNGNTTGLVWDSCGWTTAYTYNPTDGYTFLAQDPEGGQGSRGTSISGDGSTVVGWDKATTGFWRGSIWRNGVQEIVEGEPVYCWCDPETDPDCEPSYVAGEAQGANYDGSIIVGSDLQTMRTFFHPWFGEVTACVGEGWMLKEGDTLAHSMGEAYIGGYRPIPSSVSNDGAVAGGILFGSSPWDPRYAGFWTEYTGWIDFTAFLNAQGTYAPNWYILSNQSISGDGKTVGGWAATPYSNAQGYVIDFDTVAMCAPDATDPEVGHTVVVDFPHQMGCYLEHGATLGYCTSGGAALTDDEGGDGIFDPCANLGGDDENYDEDNFLNKEFGNSSDGMSDERHVGFGRH